MSLFVELPDALVALLVVGASCALSLVPYLLARRLLISRTDERSADLAGSVLFRVGALHSLILALVFAQELLNFNETRHSMTREAALVGNVYYDLARFDDAATAPLRSHLRAYADIVRDREWRLLATESRLDPEAWTAWQLAYEGILDLEASGHRQTALRDIMIEQAREISALRISRESASLVTVNDLFLYAAVAGIVIMSIAYFPFAPTAVNLTLLLAFATYTGLVLYFIIAFSNPFSGGGIVEPVRFERLYEGMRQAG